MRLTLPGLSPGKKGTSMFVSGTLTLRGFVFLDSIGFLGAVIFGVGGGSVTLGLVVVAFVVASGVVSTTTGGCVVTFLVGGVFLVMGLVRCSMTDGVDRKAGTVGVGALHVLSQFLQHSNLTSHLPSRSPKML